MKHFKGLWHYKGRTYATLRAALLAVWPERKAILRAIIAMPPGSVFRSRNVRWSRRTVGRAPKT